MFGPFFITEYTSFCVSHLLPNLRMVVEYLTCRKVCTWKSAYPNSLRDTKSWLAPFALFALFYLCYKGDVHNASKETTFDSLWTCSIVYELEKITLKRCNLNSWKAIKKPFDIPVRLVPDNWNCFHQRNAENKSTLEEKSTRLAVKQIDPYNDCFLLLPKFW